MKPRRFLSLAFGLVAVLALAVALWHLRARREAERELAAVAILRQEAAREVRSAAGSPGPASATAPVTRESSPPQPAASPDKAGAQTAATERASLVELNERLKRRRADPTVQNAELAGYRVEAANRYGLFFRRAALSPAQAEAFTDIFLRYQAGVVDLLAAAEAQGLTRSDPAVRQLRREVEQQRGTALRELLGEAGVAQLSAYDQDTMGLDTVRQWVGAATAAGIPFATAQIDDMAGVLAPAFADRSLQRKVDWARLAARLRTTLSPEQFEFVELRLKLQEAQERSARAFWEADQLLSSTPAKPGR